MSRCGCVSTGCACLLQAGANVTVTGTGSALDPYIISSSGGGGAVVQVADSASIDFSISGDGSGGNPYIITGSVIAEAIQDIVGAMAVAGDGLSYNDGAGSLSACISVDAGNQLIYGTDGCLYAAAADPTAFMTLGTAQNVTAAKTWVLPNDTTTAIRINTVAGVNPTTSSDTFAIYWSGTVRTGWFNEWGGLRVFTVNPVNLGYSDQAVKLFSRQDVDTFQIIRANTSDIGFRLRDVGTSLVQQYGGYSAWVTLASFSNGFLAYALTTFYAPEVRLRVGGDGPEFKGRITTDSTPTAGQTICNVPASPAGMRPVRTLNLSAAADDGTLVRLDLEPGGNLVCQTSGTYTYFSLDGVSAYGGAD